MIELANKISEWIGRYASDNGIESLVVGVSGGVDSALVSTLCATTGMRTIVVTMPIDHGHGHFGEDLSTRHINWLVSKFPMVEHLDVPLTDQYRSMESGLAALAHPESDLHVPLANVQSRLRMVTLYHVAAINKGIVVGTGNKIEDFGIGFFTKYGDGGVDISPIADLMKSEVVAMAECLGVDPDITAAKPTDGLYADGRNDEDQIGATYDQLEWAMRYENGELFHNGLDEEKEEWLRIYRRRHAANLHKMSPPPVFLKPNSGK